jgi:hypothetical protein
MRARHRHFKPTSVGAFIAVDSRYINQSDNTAISTWSDRSGSANDVTQATGANQPVYRTGVLGGNGVVRFDGSNDFLESPTIVKSQPYTSFLVNLPKQFYSNYNEVFEDSSLGCLSAIAPSGGVAKHDTYAGVDLFGVAATVNAWFIGNHVFNGSSSKNEINGGSITTGNAGTNNINGKFQVGRNWNSTIYVNNDFAFGMVCSGALSDSLRQRIDHSNAYSFKLACS